MDILNFSDVVYRDGIVFKNDVLFSGIIIDNNSIEKYFKGELNGMYKIFHNSQSFEVHSYYNGVLNGFQIYVEKYDNIYKICFWDMDSFIEEILFNDKGEISRVYNISEDEFEQKCWINSRNMNISENVYNDNNDFLPFYNQQNELKEKVIVKDELPSEIKCIAGVDVAYNELEERVVAGIVILDAQTLQIIEEVTHEDKVSFPYVPGLFSFREVPPLLEAFKKLKSKPDLIVCDGHGIAHPKGVGMATHLGIELNIPTIGCAKKRLVGYYEEPEIERGSNSPMIFASKEVGKALRTQDGIKPVFVSVGHKISLETACKWILHLTPNYRLPETTRAVDSLVNKLMKECTDWDTPLEFYQKKMEEQQKGSSDISFPQSLPKARRGL